MTNLSFSQKRYQSIDALRGFALAGIVFAHMMKHYIASAHPETGMEKVFQGTIDQVVNGIVMFFIVGKFFALFSVLFGLSFFLQMDRAGQRGVNYAMTFLWRLILLFLIGYLHHLFYRGDILTIYAFVGIFLIPLYGLSTKVLLYLAGIIFAGTGSYLIYYFFGTTSLFESTSGAPDAVGLQVYFDTLKHGSLIDVFAHNATEGMLNKLDFQFGLVGRGYLTLGYFIIGLWLGKIGIFQALGAYKKQIGHFMLILIGVFIILIVFGGGLGYLANSSAQGLEWDSWMMRFLNTIGGLINTVILGWIIGGFLLLFLKRPDSSFFQWMAPYGKMALTNYIGQSLIATFFLYGWGLGFLGEIRAVYMFLLSFVLVGFQVVFSLYWLKYFKYGPLEWLWRSATYGKWQPLKK